MYYVVYFSNHNNKMYSSIVECSLFNPIEFADKMLPDGYIIVNWKKLSKEESDDVTNYMNKENE